ncbi:TniQ family protein [Methylobacterium brachiatum]|uniref:TniQ family protein n=1 Tax=Methylobacterium brachiatum TaxID=269660 RepID=A0ABV1R5T2_9HYPH
MNGGATTLPARDTFLNLGHPLQPKEPAMGYAARLAALNGVDLRTLLRDMRIDVEALGRGDGRALDALAALNRQNPASRSDLGRYTPSHDVGDKNVVVGGHRFPPGSALASATRVCPHCVAEDLARFEGPTEARPWSRLEWLLEPMRVCGRHGTVLVHVEANATLRAGHDFSATLADRVLPVLDRLRTEAAPAPGTAFVDWFAARLDGTCDPGNWLDDVPLHAASAFCEALGVSVIHGPGTHPSDMGDLARAAEEGYRIAARGADAVEDALDGIVGRLSFGKRGSIGHGKVYGRVHAVLRSNRQDPAFEKFRHVLREHAFSKLPISPGTAFLGVRLDERRMHTQRSAAFSSSRSDVGLLRLIGAEAVAEGRRLWITVEEFGKVVANVEDHLTAKDVAARTGFSVKQVGHLEEAGLLPVLPEADRNAGSKRRFLRPEVDAFMSRLFQNAVPVANPAEPRMTIDRAAPGLRVGTVEILNLILDGRLAWVGRHTTGRRYGDLLIDRNELFRVIQGEGSADDVTETEAAAMLAGVDPKNLWCLVREGMLEWSPGYRPRDPRSVRALTRASVEAFASEYVTLMEATAYLGLSPQQAMRRLAEGGVREAAPYDRVRTKLYRRRDLKACRPGADAA